MAKLSRQPRLFEQTMVLANGATVKVQTTVPKKVVKLTTDPTAHPAWNPDRNKGQLDTTGQASRFLRRYEGFFDATAGTEAAAAAEPAAKPTAKPAKVAAAAPAKAAAAGKKK